MRKEQKSLAIPIIYSATVDIKEIRITKSVLVLQDSTENCKLSGIVSLTTLCQIFVIMASVDDNKDY